MRKSRSVCLPVLCVLLFTGVYQCFSQPWRLSERRMAQLEAQVRELTAKVRTLEARISSLETINQFPSTEKLRQGMIQANKDAMINDLNNFAANAYQYRIRPTTMGGGGGVYSHYTIPIRLSRNDNALYSLGTVSNDTVVFVATSGLNLGTITCVLDITGRLHGFEYTGEFK